MKKLIFLGCGILICLYACKVDNNTMVTIPAPISITGKWNVVVDSTGNGAGSSVYFKAYNGQPGDFFNFTTKGLVYTKEGAVLDTMSYSLISDSAINIQPFGVSSNGAPIISHITNFTANSLTIYQPWVFSPGGAFGRKVILSR